MTSFKSGDPIDGLPLRQSMSKMDSSSLDGMNLLQLPSEIIYQIVGYFPTASCLWNLAQTCRHLYRVISADDFRVCQAFVQRRFAGIDTPPLWKEAARALTSRSRAFDRCAVFARYVIPPSDAARLGQAKTVRTDRPTLGYRPVIDSYETWYGQSWLDRKEVLVWGAGADLIMRTTDYGKSDTIIHGLRCPAEKWTVFNDLTDVDSWDDISSVHLLPSTQSSKSADAEDLILGRRNGKLVRMSISPAEGSFATTKTYSTGDRKLESTDLSMGPGRVLAATFGNRSISFFKVDAEEEAVESFATMEASPRNSTRNPCSRLLSDDQIAVGDDGDRGKISIFTLASEGITNIRDMELDSCDLGDKRSSRVTTLAPLNQNNDPGSRWTRDLFLSGWEDSTVRLHDLRSPKPHVSKFIDTVDHSPAYCLRPVGCERFMVGAGEMALLKLFDMRMPGSHNYMNTGSPAIQSYFHCHPRTNDYTSLGPPLESITYPRKDISIYLSQKHPSTLRRSEHGRYRGPIYTICPPSASSSSFYVGVEGGVIRLDVTDTDDLRGAQADWFITNSNLVAEIEDNTREPPFPLTCYKRPGARDANTHPHLCWQELNMRALRRERRDKDSWGSTMPGWDRPWARTPGHAMFGRGRRGGRRGRQT